MQPRVERPIDLLAVLCAASGLTGCDRILGDPDYHVTAQQGAVSAAELRERLRPPTAACSSCLSLACEAELSGCAERQSCVTLVDCVLNEPSPASEARCVLALEPNEEDRASSRALADCWRACAVECDGGRDFSCAGNYSWPAPSHDTIQLSQTLSDILDPSAPFAGAQVSICSPALHCEQPLQLHAEPVVVTTDETGFYTVEVPISTAPPSVAGFRGYRRVESEGNLTHRLQTSMPLIVDHVEHTKLLRKVWTDALLADAQVEGELNGLLMQVFDCRGVGAQGVTVQV
jgi:hypothetical protein